MRSTNPQSVLPGGGGPWGGWDGYWGWAHSYRDPVGGGGAYDSMRQLPIVKQYPPIYPPWSPPPPLLANGMVISKSGKPLLSGTVGAPFGGAGKICLVGIRVGGILWNS